MYNGDLINSGFGKWCRGLKMPSKEGQLGDIYKRFKLKTA
jgi:hypothetical protein